MGETLLVSFDQSNIEHRLKPKDELTLNFIGADIQKPIFKISAEKLFEILNHYSDLVL